MMLWAISYLKSDRIMLLTGIRKHIKNIKHIEFKTYMAINYLHLIKLVLTTYLLYKVNL